MPRKILSIDGGGIKGVFPASFLSAIEEIEKVNIADHFDLIVGTSTGGIVALGLGLGFSAKEILHFYEESGPEIFKGNKILKFFRHFGMSKYSQLPLKQALQKTFGNRTLGESSSRLVIPSFNLDTGDVHIFKTSHHPRFVTDYKEQVVNVALSTAAAPTYFPVHETSSGIPLADGGLWANNPIGIAVVEAIGVLDWDKNDIQVLSIGCTEAPLDMKARGGKLPWAPKIADVFLTAQSSAAMGMAKHLIGHHNIIRINPVMPNQKYDIDSIQSINSLKGLGVSEARKMSSAIHPFFTTPVEKFVPSNR